MGRTRTIDESGLVKLEPNHAGLKGRRAIRTSCPQASPLLALRSRRPNVANSYRSSQNALISMWSDDSKCLKQVDAVDPVTDAERKRGRDGTEVVAAPVACFRLQNAVDEVV